MVRILYKTFYFCTCYDLLQLVIYTAALYDNTVKMMKQLSV